ncbi:MAG: DUF4954 family protein [Candidatus Brocadiia bacterium]
MEYRSLTAQEISELEDAGCHAEEWSRVLVAEGFRPGAVARCTFSGAVRLGAFEEPIRHGATHLPSGVRDSYLHEVTVGSNSLVQSVGLLANYDVGREACILSCDSLTVEGETSFGNGVRIEVLNEGGGREIPLFDRLSAPVAYLAVCYRHRPRLVDAIEQMVRHYAAGKEGTRGAIGEGARVLNCRTIRNVAIGVRATLEGCTLLQNGTICSSAEAPTTVGAGVTASDFIIGTGSVVDGGAMLKQCFVGQACRIGRQFSAEGSAFFANTECFHGEAVSVLAGPYTVSHHKSTLLIAGVFSFYNAGSGTNQSNHMYKLGPLHQGVVERGSKTGSSSYLLWPSRVGPFTVVLGKHSAHFDTGSLPFSYIDESDGRSVLWPALNLFTTGTKRDGMKWAARDRRTDPEKLDPIRFEVFSPLTVGRMMQGIAELEELYASAPREQEYVRHVGIDIKRLLCRRAPRRYRMAVEAYLGETLVRRLEAAEDPADALARPSAGAAGEGDWVDLLGLLAPRGQVESLCDAVERGQVDTLDALQGRLQALCDAYEDHEWAWVLAAWEEWHGEVPAKMSTAELAGVVRDWEETALKLNAMILKDAQKEFDQTSRIGYGSDGGGEAQSRDFQAVRGEFETNEFVRTLREESETIRARARAVLSALGAAGEE